MIVFSVFLIKQLFIHKVKINVYFLEEKIGKLRIFYISKVLEQKTKTTWNCLNCKINI